eukprot:SAG31_NODE_11508_length_1022_cov_1.815818_2_plen_151_part_00
MILRMLVGGVRQSAFAHWRGMIPPASRSSEIVSSLDVFPTFSALAGVPLPVGVVYDGRDMRDVLLKPTGKSLHTEPLFLYATSSPNLVGPAAARYGRWKAHWYTSPGLGGCAAKLPLCPTSGQPMCALPGCNYPLNNPLLFDIAGAHACL